MDDRSRLKSSSCARPDSRGGRLHHGLADTVGVCSKDFILDKVRMLAEVTSKLQLTVPRQSLTNTAFGRGTNWSGFLRARAFVSS